METLVTRKTLGTALAVSLLTACGGAGSGVPSATSAMARSAGRVASDASHGNLSGQYKGTFTDSIDGTGKAVANYSQYQSAVGGMTSIKYKTGAMTLAVVFTANAESVSGNSIALEGSTYCTLSTESTYNSKKHILSGTYSAVQGCGTESGSFTLKQKCYYQGTGSDIRRETGLKSC